MPFNEVHMVVSSHFVVCILFLVLLFEANMFSTVVAPSCVTSSESLLFSHCILICPFCEQFVGGLQELCCYHSAVMQGIALALHRLQHSVHRLYECNTSGRVKSSNTCPTFLPVKSRCCQGDSVMDLVDHCAIRSLNLIKSPLSFVNSGFFVCLLYGALLSKGPFKEYGSRPLCTLWQAQNVAGVEGSFLWKRLFLLKQFNRVHTTDHAVVLKLGQFLRIASTNVAYQVLSGKHGQSTSHNCRLPCMYMCEVGLTSLNT